MVEHQSLVKTSSSLLFLHQSSQTWKCTEVKTEIYLSCFSIEIRSQSSTVVRLDVNERCPFFDDDSKDDDDDDAEIEVEVENVYQVDGVVEVKDVLLGPPHLVVATLSEN